MKKLSVTSTLRHGVCLGTVLAAGFVAAASSAQATVTTYTSQSTFINALHDPAYFESFNEFGGQIVNGPQVFSFGPVGFTLSETNPATTQNIYYSDGGGTEGSVFPGPANFTQSFVLTFTGQVTAVGGTFFLSDNNFNGSAGTVTAQLATGESVVLTSTTSYGTQPFGGFTSTTPITSLTLTKTGTASNYVSLDNLYVSGTAVPEPSTWALALVGTTGLLLVARRRLA